MSDSPELPVPAAAPPADDPIESAFHVWLASGGDAASAARVLGVAPADVRRLAKENRWETRLRALAEVGAAGALTPDDYHEAQIALNRGVNYVQAHRLRVLCDRALLEFNASRSLLADFTATDKHGNTSIDFKPLADLARVTEIAHRLTSNALGDDWAAGKRPVGRRPAGAGAASTDVARAMNAVAQNPETPSADIATGG